MSEYEDMNTNGVVNSSIVASTLHWLLLTFKSQGSYALVSLAD